MNPVPPQPLRVQSLYGKRTAIPKVLGILAIVFSVIGVLFAVVQTFGTYADIDNLGASTSELGTFGTWVSAYMVFAIILFALHLTAGILSVRYSTRTIKIMNGYAIFALLLALANIGITLTSYPDFLKHSGGHMGRVFLEVMALPWPIVVLSLINTERCNRACSGQQRIPKANIA